MKTVLETLQAGTAYLEKRQVPEARLNMQLLLAHQLGCSKLDLYQQFDRPLGEEELSPLRELLKRRGLREPLQHILGEVEFAGNSFKCDSRALIPRPETEELVTALIDSPPDLSKGDRVIDVGTGSGVIGLSLANAWRDRGLEIILVDAQDSALSLARENAEQLGLKEAVSIKKSHLLDDAPGPYQLIVANLCIQYEQLGSIDSTQLLQLANCLHFMDSHLDAPLHLADLARAAGMSERSLSRSFHSALGQSPIEYLLNVRLQRAEELLLAGPTPISQIAFEVGFGDANYFTRQFRKRRGLSPRQFRKQYRKS